MGTRTTANVSEKTTLEFQFLHNGEPYDAYEITKVTIHGSEADAIADTGIYQTIPSYSITRKGVGLYEYIVDELTVEGIYYDKIFVTPADDISTIFFINEFYVEEVPPTATGCYVSGTIMDEEGEPFEGVRVYAMPSTIPAIIETSTGNIAIAVSSVNTVTDSNGYFRLLLIKTLSYNITIKEIGLKDTIIVPDSSNTDLFSLLGASIQGTIVPSDTDWT
jgi:hypothetical protein